MMKIDIITALPEILESMVNSSILKRGMEKGLVEINIRNLRDWTEDRHNTVDDTPYGGGPGMVMKVEPIYKAIKDLREPESLVILTSPRGKVLEQALVRELLEYKHLIILCGHYKELDERVRKYVDMEISVGDFILTGGEIPAALITDAVTRLIPGVISDIESANSDSFENGLLDCAYYTRPQEFDNETVPEVLVNGNHKLIDKWRHESSLEITKRYRPDLYEAYVGKTNEKS